jgi:hypothetical protein
VSKEIQSVSGTVSDQLPTSAGNPNAHNQERVMYQLVRKVVLALHL